MRLRLPELLEERNITAYRLSVQSGGRVPLSTIYRLVRQKGRVGYFDADVLEAICEVLGIGPGELLEHGNGGSDRRARRKRHQRRAPKG